MHMTDSERFAFIPRRYHGFASTGNAYDATQSDEAIKPGDTLLILPERVVGIAHCWPFAVTKEPGKLHSITPKPGDTLDDFARSFKIEVADFVAAVTIATALGFEIDPVVAAFLSAPSA